MPELNYILDAEDKIWRNKPYSEIKSFLGNVECYVKKHKGKEYQVEIHTKIGSNDDEIIVMVECSKNSFLGSFVGRCYYFAKLKDGLIREIDGDEAF